MLSSEEGEKMRKVILLVFLAILMTVLNLACGSKSPVETTPTPTSEQGEEEGWCERNFDTCVTIISISGGVFLGVIAGVITGVAIGQNH